jgi:hypothetical protein
VARVDRRWARWEIPTISLVSGRPGLSASRTCAILLFALLLGAAIGAAAASEAGSPVAKRQTCPPMRPDAGYSGRVERALRAGKDLWGNALLADPSGPTYVSARRFLTPLFHARAPGKRPLTDSGVHYVAFSQPLGPQGGGSVALHVGDGSQIASDRAEGRRLTLFVGARGRERYGSCIRRLAPARLFGGYLPILETRYVDGQGARYAQQSFAARVPQTGPLVSFVRLAIDTRRATSPITRVRFVPSVVRRSLSYAVPRGATRTVYVGWLNTRPSRPLPFDEAAYDAARQSLVDYWDRRLAEGATYAVPEKHVNDAQRNLLIQNLGLTWRYSIGNPYEQFSFPESADVAQVMAEYGFGAVARSILTTSLTKKPRPYPNWKRGEKLLGSALYYSLHRDRAYVDQVFPVLRRYVASLGRQLTARGRGLLRRERYSSDIPDSVHGLHSQAVAWQSLKAIARVWAETEHGSAAEAAGRTAARLEAGLRRAVRASQTRLPDGSLFIPVQLGDRVQPYEALTASRLGSYWNLVMPYALASGLFRPGSAQATGVLSYMLNHGSRLLGLVRAGAYALYRNPVFPTSGTDQVYGINVARFLADNNKPDQLVLSLYGHLAAGMSEGTFVSGEAASVAPLAGSYFRSMYLPPNGASNAAFLTTLRMMLVHERIDRDGDPVGLELAYATPRTWLEPGRRIVVSGAPTSFGPVSFALEAFESSVHARVTVPERGQPHRLKLRLRLPRGRHITSVTLDGRPFTRVDRATETLDLSGRRGTLELAVGFRTRSS